MKKWQRRSKPFTWSPKHNGPGYVYLLTNEHYKSDIIKIGFTRRDPKYRAFELYDGITGIPGEFKVAFSIWVRDCEFTESKLHDLLAQFRVNEFREFFKVPLSKAIELTQRVADIVNELKKEVGTLIKYNVCGQINRVKGEYENVVVRCGKCNAILPIGRPPTWNKETGMFE